MGSQGKEVFSMELNSFHDQNPNELFPVRGLKQQLHDRCGHPRFRLWGPGALGF